MVITEAELRELWRDGRNPLPAFPPGTRFSPSAQDFIKDHRLEIHFAEPALSPILTPQLPALAPTTGVGVTHNSLPASLDALHALARLVAAEARRYQLPALAGRLDALAADCQTLAGTAQHGRDLAPRPPAPTAGAMFAPGPTDHAILHWLNYLSAMARLNAALAEAAGQAHLAAGLGQVSQTAADLGGRVQSGELGWKSAMV